MTTYNTGNPLGSTDARDLSDNAQNLDKAVNSSDLTFIDRLGMTRPTWNGLAQYAGPAYDVSNYASLAAAVAAFPSTPATIQYGEDQTLTANLVVPAHIELMPLNGAVISHGAYTVTVNSSTARWPLAQIFNGTGDVTGLQEAYPQWFGTDGAADQVQIRAALVASATVRLVGSYDVGETIEVAGNRSILGVDAGVPAYQPTVINHSAASGPLFSAVSNEFGGVRIANFMITGGNGSPAIVSSRAQSVYEYLHMEPYNGGGIQLLATGAGSWGTTIRECKWVAPASPTAYTGYEISVNGGDVTLDHVTAIRGAIGINILQGETITLITPSTNYQSNNPSGTVYSSATSENTAGIKLSGAGYKKSITILNPYIEAFTHGLYVESVEGLNLLGGYIADAGLNSNNSSVFLKDANCVGVKLTGATISSNGNSSSSIKIGSGVNGSILEGLIISDTGIGSGNINNVGGANIYLLSNKLTYGGTGYGLSDTVYGTVNLDATVTGFSNYKRVQTVQAATAAELVSIANAEMWEATAFTNGAVGTAGKRSLIVVDNAGTARVETLATWTAGGYNVTFTVAGGKIKVSHDSGGAVSLNIALQKLK
ncbi:MAG TPA: hypothetical protein DCS05_00490 [Nitrospiraceae bacterium]|nr:hypothetical protein [Nitrospiraceae bacterium]